MGKSVSILITNFNGGDTIALCVESIRKFTSYPHDIIVYDDASFKEYQDELAYLRGAQENGWLRLIEGKERIMHGRALSIMLDECKSDLAMILDNDIQITGQGWLTDMVKAQESRGAAMVADQESFPDDNVAISSWFFMLDMTQYPHAKDVWDYTRKVEDDPSKGYRPTGWRIWKKINDQKRGIAPVPKPVKGRYVHHAHIGVLSYPMSGPGWDIRQQRYAVIQAELKKLRGAK